MNATLVPLFMLLATAMDVLERWYRRYDRNHWEGDPWDNRWISWGWIAEGCGPGEPPMDLPRIGMEDRRYFMLCLPVYRWQPINFGLDHALLPVVLMWTSCWGWEVI